MSFKLDYLSHRCKAGSDAFGMRLPSMRTRCHASSILRYKLLQIEPLPLLQGRIAITRSSMDKTTNSSPPQTHGKHFGQEIKLGLGQKQFGIRIMFLNMLLYFGYAPGQAPCEVSSCCVVSYYHNLLWHLQPALLNQRSFAASLPLQ